MFFIRFIIRVTGVLIIRKGWRRKKILKLGGGEVRNY